MRVILVPNFQIEYSIQLANGLCEYVDLTIVVWESLAPELMGLLDKRVTVIPCGSPGELIRGRIANEARIFRLLRRNQCDVVHFQNAYVWRLPALTFLGEEKCVVTIHDPRQHAGHFDPWSFLAIALHANRADGLVTLGARQREILLDRFDLDRDEVFVIPHGEFSFFERFASEAPMDPPTVLFIGRIASYKGLEYFLRSIPRIAMKLPATRFRIVGAGDIRPYRASFRDLPNLEVENTHVSMAQVAREIGRAAVVVAPYIEASQSGIVIAAQSLGRPVVVTDVGGLPDDLIPGETGLLVSPRDPRAIADAVISILEDHTLREKMGRRARQWMVTTRSWKDIARETMALYEAIT